MGGASNVGTGSLSGSSYGGSSGGSYGKGPSAGGQSYNGYPSAPAGYYAYGGNQYPGNMPQQPLQPLQSTSDQTQSQAQSAASQSQDQTQSAASQSQDQGAPAPSSSSDTQSLNVPASVLSGYNTSAQNASPLDGQQNQFMQNMTQGRGMGGKGFQSGGAVRHISEKDVKRILDALSKSRVVVKTTKK